MAKKLVGTLKLQIPAGGANPSPVIVRSFLLGSTNEDQIKPDNKTIIDKIKPLKIKSLGSSQPPLRIVKPNIKVDINAEKIQNKQKASIL